MSTFTDKPNAKTIKISYKFYPEKIAKKNKHTKQGNYCLACGSPLTDPISIWRGHGKRCWEKVPVIIVLDIPSRDLK